MSVSVYNPSGALPQMSGPHATVAVSRPQVGIERLPARRMSNEPRESMNCKSCRKRKIKCNRLRPACEACQVFQCPCIYDAVPKKRGPKTDVLDALLKRVDGLEAKLREKNAEQVPSSSSTEATTAVKEAADEELEKPPHKRLTVDTRASPTGGNLGDSRFHHQVKGTSPATSAG
uniref:Zn(2)-C6 fungal-type domain-containing protein n=1 Tax=Bionectria ochroleuca TaxID=29856 RepID=A0A8H7KD44_BIOOC